MHDIAVEDFKIEVSESGIIELIYIPSQTQTFRRGEKYRFRIELGLKDYETLTGEGEE
jgi:hypothetical protein